MSMFEVVKEHIKSLYIGKCMIEEYRSTLGLVNNTKIVTAYQDVPCRLSYKSFPSSHKTETNTNIIQSIKLFLSPDIKIKPGSRITIEQNGETNIFECSGKPAIYATHQEVELVREETS